MSEPSYSVEIGLVTCLLFICIECVRGDYPAAFMHLHSGLKIIAQMGSPPAIPLARTVADPGLIANKLAPIFTRAITNGLLFGAPFEPLLDGYCTRPKAFHKHTFESITEAQTVLFELRNATVIQISVLYRKLLGASRLNSGDLQYRLQLLHCHHQWLRSLKNLESERKISSGDIAVLSSLKVSYYCTYIALAGALDMEQIVFDAHLESVKALNHHAKVVLDSMGLCSSPSSGSTPTRSDRKLSSYGKKALIPSPLPAQSPAAHFTFEIALIAPLVSTHPTLRRGA